MGARGWAPTSRPLPPALCCAAESCSGKSVELELKAVDGDRPVRLALRVSECATEFWDVDEGEAASDSPVMTPRSAGGKAAFAGKAATDIGDMGDMEAIPRAAHEIVCRLNIGALLSAKGGKLSMGSPKPKPPATASPKPPAAAPAAPKPTGLASPAAAPAAGAMASPRASAAWTNSPRFLASVTSPSARLTQSAVFRPSELRASASPADHLPSYQRPTTAHVMRSKNAPEVRDGGRGWAGY